MRAGKLRLGTGVLVHAWQGVKNHRIVRLEGTMMAHLIQPLCSSGVILEGIGQDCVQMVF